MRMEVRSNNRLGIMLLARGPGRRAPETVKEHTRMAAEHSLFVKKDTF